MIFVETGAWFACFRHDEPDHARAAKTFEANHERLITSDDCTDKVLPLLAARI
jgi:predicted nucleic acid-binding protein